MNDSVVRLGVVEGEYHWHKHDDDDEFFYVVEGELLIDLGLFRPATNWWATCLLRSTAAKLHARFR